MKTLLLTNDDGYLSEGIQRLKRVLSADYRVYVVAPDRERSAISMSLTIHHPLRLRRMAENEYAIDGTPADCVNIALQKILPNPPDFVVSGMNEGENLCEDVFFSGTVAGAFTGSLYGIPSLAVSLIDEGKGKPFAYEDGAHVTAGVLEKLLPLNDHSVVYNLNIPAGHDGAIAVTALGLKRYTPSIIERTDPRGRKYYWIGTGNPTLAGEKGTDLKAVRNKTISLSVLKYDLNTPQELLKLQEAFNGRKT
jgi:5'-nucleotidase